MFNTALFNTGAYFAMKPLFQSQLLNNPFEDPVLFVDFLFERRALLFDLGSIRNLSPRKILRVSDIFVSHAHMDHFADFDWLLRHVVGRDKRIRMYGPPSRMLAGIAKVKRIVPCHLSPRYIDRQHDLLDEALEGSRLLESGRRTLSGSGLNQRE